MLKNIIIVNDFAHVQGGAGKVAISSAIGLAGRGYNVILFCAVRPVCKELAESSVKIVCTEQHDILSNPRRIDAMVQGIWNKTSANRFREMLSELSPQDTVIHIHALTKALSVSLLNVLSCLEFRIFYTLHDFFLYCPNGGLYNYNKKEICGHKPMGVKCLFCNCDSRSYVQKLWRCIRQIFIDIQIAKLRHKITFISISNLSERMFQQHIGNGCKVARINNPIDAPLTVDMARNKREHYLYMGRTSPEKGIDLFCEAVSRLRVPGIVVGSSDTVESYRQKYQNIDFVGWKNGYEKVPYIQNAKCLVFPSRWYETFGLSPMEMLFYGIPCIIPDRCAASEYIKDGVNGYVFKTGDIRSLEDAIKKMEETILYENYDAIKLSINEDEYSIETHINELIKIYDKQ